MIVIAHPGPAQTMHYFTTQLPAERAAARSLRASLYRKKARPEPEEEHQQPLASPETISQDQVPPTPFPHAPANTSTHYHGAPQVYEEMAKSPVRLYAATAPDSNIVSGHRAASALKLKHLNLLSTVMHRCLLEGDYERAGRAWGIILRTQAAGGRPVDLRNNGRWGIGAEVLLRRRSRAVAVTEQREPAPNTYDPSDGDMFCEEGFDLAKEYYQRLIIEYPHRKQRPHLTNERYFYPAMFSLWIFEVCEKSKRARRKAQEEVAFQSHSSMSAPIDSDYDNGADNHRLRENAIQVEELALAAEIAERLDQLIASPPFDQEISLLQLRGHVCLWISHLHIATTTSNNQPDADLVMGNAEDPSADHLTNITTGNRELQQAQIFFNRAVENGAQGQAAMLSSIEIRIRELAQ